MARIEAAGTASRGAARGVRVRPGRRRARGRPQVQPLARRRRHAVRAHRARAPGARPGPSRGPVSTARSRRPGRFPIESVGKGATMRISAKADYAVRALCELAARQDGCPVKGEVIATAQQHPAEVPGEHPERAEAARLRAHPARAPTAATGSPATRGRSRWPRSSGPSTGRWPTCEASDPSSWSCTAAPLPCRTCGWPCGSASDGSWRASRWPTWPVATCRPWSSSWWPTRTPSAPTERRRTAERRRGLVARVLVGFAVAVVCTPAGVSGAFVLLPVQTQVFHVPSPAVSATNLVYNLLSAPAGDRDVLPSAQPRRAAGR